MEKKIKRFLLATKNNGKAIDATCSKGITNVHEKTGDIAIVRKMIPLQGLRALIFEKRKSPLKSSANALILHLITHS